MTKRWSMLILGCIAQLGGYMSMNFPSYMYLQTLAIFGIDSIEFNIIYTVISFPNMFMPFFMGIISQKYLSPRVLFILTVTLNFVGHTLCTLAFITKQFYLLIIGRTLLGIGDTNIHVPRNEIITKWFLNKELTFAFSLFPSVGRGGIFAVAYMFTFYQDVSLDQMYKPVLYINIVCFLSFLCSLVFIYIDTYHDQETEKALDEEQLNNQNNISIQMDDNYKCGELQEEKEKEKKDEGFLNLNRYPTIFWLIIIVSCIGYAMFFPYNNNIQLILKQKYGIQGKFTVMVQMIPMVMSTLFSPITGWIVDKKGKIPLLLIMSGLIASCAYFISACDPGLFIPNYKQESLIPVLLLGVYFCIFPVIQEPSISLVVNQDMIGLGVGILMSSINFMQVFFAMGTGYLLKKDPENGYFDTSLLFLAACAFFIILSITLYIKDIRGNRCLYNCSKQIRKLTQDSIADLPQNQVSNRSIQVKEVRKRISSNHSLHKKSQHSLA